MTGDIEGTPVGTDNVLGFMRGAMNEGLSPTAALDAFREAGAGMRTQRWYDLWRSESAIMAQYPETLALDPNTVPTFADQEAFEMGSTPGYAARVRVTMWDIESQQFVDQWWLYTKTDPFTPAEAEAAALETWSGIGDIGRYETYAVGATTVRVGPIVPYNPGG